jgi:hypothetical protein
MELLNIDFNKIAEMLKDNDYLGIIHYLFGDVENKFGQPYSEEVLKTLNSIVPILRSYNIDFPHELIYAYYNKITIEKHEKSEKSHQAHVHQKRENTKNYFIKWLQGKIFPRNKQMIIDAIKKELSNHPYDTLINEKTIFKDDMLLVGQEYYDKRYHAPFVLFSHKLISLEEAKKDNWSFLFKRPNLKVPCMVYVTSIGYTKIRSMLVEIREPIIIKEDI